MTRTIKFETTQCVRCFGTGRMPYAAYGGVCFKCNGHGEVFSRKGKAARKAFYSVLAERLPVVQVSTLQVGDLWSYLARGDRPSWVTTVSTEILDDGRICVSTKRADHVLTATLEVRKYDRDAYIAAYARVAEMSGATVTTTEGA